MEDGDVSKQIQQMVEFIRQEAHEKAFEISVSAEEEFNIEKLQLVEAEKKKIRQEFERKAHQVHLRNRIEYSMQLNGSRIKFLKAQDEIVNDMKETASKELLRFSDKPNQNTAYSYSYKKLLQAFSSDDNNPASNYNYLKLLQALIVQSLLRLKEPSVLLRCREMDKKAVESVLEDSKREYAEIANAPMPVITLHKIYLPPPPPPPPSASDHHSSSCSGGVVMASQDGKIVCENTLDARLDVAFRHKLPQIRKHIFG